MKKLLEDFIKSPHFPEGTAWKRKKYNMNDRVVNEGDLGTSLFFVVDGELRVTGSVDLGEDKRMQPGICDLKAGALFGESCLHMSLPRIATVTAITEATLLEINGERLSIFLDEHPVQGYLFYKNLFELLIVRLNSANQRVETLISWGLKAHEIDRYL
jgi:CRP-like cAMP-binding protein